MFLDRDGTLTVRPSPGTYVRSPEQLELLPGAAEAVRRINEAGVLAILVTNQRWVSEPDSTVASYERVDERLGELLSVTGGQLDGRYVCTHGLDSCDCRKPAPGLLLRAAEELGVDLPRSVMIGDSATDIAAGRRAGTRCALIAHASDPAPVPEAPDVPIFRSLEEAVRWAV